MPGDTSNEEKGSLIEDQHKSVKTFILTLTLEGNMSSFGLIVVRRTYNSVQSRVKENKISKQNNKISFLAYTRKSKLIE